MVRGLCESARDNQIIIPTHSLELMDELLLETEGPEPDIDVRFFHLDRDSESSILETRSVDLREAIECRDLDEQIGTCEAELR